MALSPSLTAIFLSLSLFALCSTNANGHGMMCGPRQRGAYHSESKCGSNLPEPPNPVTDYCGHCLNGGTAATVTANLPASGWEVYDPTKDIRTAQRAGLCGDPRGRVDHMIGGDFMPYDTVPIVEHWKTGSAVDFTVELDTNHNGYFEFHICNLDSCGTPDIDEKCFSGGHCQKLMRVQHKDCEDKNSNTFFECGPQDPEYPGRWYVPCRNTGHVGVHIVGGSAGTMRYQLPAGFECKHCVLQWYWATANSCAPRGFLDFFEAFDEPFGNECESDGGGRGAHRPGMSECGGQSVPEEFWSCADVSITSDGTAPGAIKAVGVKPPIDPATKSQDEEKVKEDPDAVLDKATEELEKDITLAANEESGKRKMEEVAAAAGNCVLEDDPCDAAVPCCDYQQVCVFTETASGFTCRFWWSLWQEVEARHANGQPM